MNIEEFVNSYLQEHRHDVLLNPYNGLIDFANTFKKQMFKDTVEGEVHPDDCEIWVNLVGYGYKFNDGDKVRIVVLKEKEE